MSEEMNNEVQETTEAQAPEVEVENDAPEKKESAFSRFFQVAKRGSTIRTEIVAGIVTFLAMCYILTVNPDQFFWAGKMTAEGPTYTAIDNPMWTSVFMATAFGAIIGTLLMAFLAKLPLAQAPGMGLNSLVGTIIGGGLGFTSTYVFQFSLANAMLMVLISGLLFLLLSIIRVKGKSLRQLIFDGIPAGIRKAIPVGIGLFIAFIGFQNSGVIVDNQYTLLDLSIFSNLFVSDGELATRLGMDISDPEKLAAAVSAAIAAKTAIKGAIVCLVGLILIAVFSHLKLKGAVIFGILGATIVGIPFGITNYKVILGDPATGITWKFWENFGNFFAGDNSVFAIAFTEGWKLPADSIFTVVMIIITMCMIDMFDTMGTCVGCCSAAGLMDENGTPLNYDKIMLSDSIATTAGAVMGTSTVTTFVESGAGIAAGGKTGLTALTTAVMFLLAIFLLPVFAMIPSAAAASALVYVGVLMMKGVKDIDFKDIRVAVPAFLAIVIMPLGYSITKGIGIAILSYVIIASLAYVVDIIKYAITKKDKPAWEVSIVTIIIAVLFAVYFFMPTVL